MSRLLLLFLLTSFAIKADAFSQYDTVSQLGNIRDLPLLRSDVKVKMFSSYDRNGGNDDGFEGTFSKLRLEDGNSVIAEMKGAGCIKRIWFTHSTFEEGLLNRKNEHIKIYIDGKKEPVLDEPLEKLFSGDLPQFAKPLTGIGLGGFYCYASIPYQNGCKVVVEGDGVHFYQITYEEYSSAETVQSFSASPSKQIKQAISNAAKLWDSAGELNALNLKNPVVVEKLINLAPGKSAKIKLPKGSYMVRAIILNDRRDDQSRLMDADLEIFWDKTKKPAVKLPLNFMFCQAFDLAEGKSVLAGYEDGGYYNYIPMPYRKRATLVIHANEALKTKVKVVIEPFKPSAEFGYLHADYIEQIPTQEDVHFKFLEMEGKGHYLGTFQVTKGTADLPVWLEGDETFTVDGTLDVHGTGSEDYYNCGWYGVDGRLNNPGYLPVHGFPVFKKVDKEYYATAYRWHVSDPVPFQKEILFQIEHGPDNKFPAEYRGAAFYYEITP